MDSKEKTIDNSLESTMNMTQEEIEWLLNQQSGSGEDNKTENVDTDLMSLLAELEATDDGDIQDISALLTKDDMNEAVDDNIAALLKAQEEPGETAYDAMDLFSGEEVKKEKKGLWGKLFHKEKTEDKEKKKEKTKKEKPPKKKKRKEKKADNEGTLDWESIELSEEHSADSNHGPMDDALALLQGTPSVEKKEEPAKKETAQKDKKGKKQKKKKNEKIKEEGKKKSGKSEGKVQKDKKNKEKEKASIEDAIKELDEEAEEAPNKKKVVMVFLASILILFGFLVVNYYFTGHANKRLAQEAFAEENYMECYQLLYGQHLNDSQKVMYHRSELILKDGIFWRDYDAYVKQAKWLEGLDELVQYVHNYPELEEYAEKWNCDDIVKSTYEQIQSILQKDYETDIEKAAEIAGLVKDEDYTRALLKIVEEKKKRDALYQEYPDILPEEEDRLLQ